MRSSSKTVAVVLLGLAAAGLVLHALAYPFITDDAYISFRYAYNLAHHGQLTFNVGERVEGYTNFLWTALLGVLLRLGLRPEAMSRILGAGFGVAGLLLTYAFTRIYRGGRATGWDALAPLMLASTASYAAWCSGGLETQMFTALVLGGMTLYLAEEAGWVTRRASGLLFALSAMTRPEGVGFFALAAFHRGATCWLGIGGREQSAGARWRRWLLLDRSSLRWIIGFAVPYGVFFLWRLLYYGYPFPNTYYIKAGGGAAAGAIKWGLPYLWDFVRENKLCLFLPLLLLFRPRTTWRREATVPGDTVTSDDGAPRRAAPDGPLGLRPAFVWTYVGLTALALSAYVVLVGGDFMTLGRFFVPLLPLLALFVQESLREMVERPRVLGTWRPLRMALTAALMVGLLLVNSVGLYRENQKLAYHRWGLDTMAYLDRFAADRIRVGTWMRKNLPLDTYLAVGGAGAIVYASRLRALDTFGLNDLYIAHGTPPVGDRPGHTKIAPESYLLKMRPDLMCHQAKHQDVRYRPPPHEELYWRHRGYGWVCLDPPGLRPAFYCCLKRLDRALGPFPAEVGS
jgi:hypothetical protein